MTTVSEFVVRPGRADPVRPHVVPLARAGARGGRPRAGARRDRDATGSTGRRRAGHVGDYHEEIHQSLLAAEGADVRADRRDRRRADDVAAGVDRRRAQLGLPLLLAARRDADAARDAPAPGTATRRWRGGSGCCGRSRAIPPTCRSCTGSPASGASRSASSSGSRGTRTRGPCGSETRLRASSSSTSTARCSTRSTRRARHGAPADDNIWALTRKLLDWLEDGWRREDAGIWEVRGPDRHFTHSKVMAWVAFDRGRPRPRGVRPRGARSTAGARSATRSRPRCSSARWSEPKQCVHPVVRLGRARCERPPDAARRVPRRPTTRGSLSTVEAIRRELTVDGLVLRYRAGGRRGRRAPRRARASSSPCSFWLAEVLALQGRHDEARELFERLLDLRNDVGLLAEEYDPSPARQLGNFPQAFTHLALVNTALALGEGRGMREVPG